MDKTSTVNRQKLNLQLTHSQAQITKQQDSGVAKKQEASLRHGSDRDSLKNRLSLGVRTASQQSDHQQLEQSQVQSFLNQNSFSSKPHSLQMQVKGLHQQKNSHLSSTNFVNPLSQMTSVHSTAALNPSNPHQSSSHSAELTLSPTQSGLTSHKVSVNRHRDSFSGQAVRSPEAQTLETMLSEDGTKIKSGSNQVSRTVKNVEIYLSASSQNEVESGSMDSKARIHGSSSNLKSQQQQQQTQRTFNNQIIGGRLSLGGVQREKDNRLSMGNVAGLDEGFNYKTMSNCLSTSQLIMNLTSKGSSTENCSNNFQDQLKQKISEARSKINSKRQSSGLQSANEHSNLSNPFLEDKLAYQTQQINQQPTSTSNLLITTQNMLLSQRKQTAFQNREAFSPKVISQNALMKQADSMRQNNGNAIGSANSQMQKSQSQINGFDLFKKQINKQRASLSPFQNITNRDTSQTSHQNSLQKKLQFYELKNLPSNKLSFAQAQDCSSSNLSSSQPRLAAQVLQSDFGSPSSQSNHFQIPAMSIASGTQQLAKLLLQQKNNIDTQDTSLDSLMQICSILPDSRGATSQANQGGVLNYYSQSHSHSHSNSNFTSNYGTAQNHVSFNERRDLFLKQKSKQSSQQSQAAAAQEYYDSQPKTNLSAIAHSEHSGMPNAHFYLKTERSHLHDENTNPQTRVLSQDREQPAKVKSIDKRSFQSQTNRDLSKFEAKSSFEKKTLGAMFKDPSHNRDNKRSSFFKSIENFHTSTNKGIEDNSYTYLSPQPESNLKYTPATTDLNRKLSRDSHQLEVRHRQNSRESDRDNQMQLLSSSNIERLQQRARRIDDEAELEEKFQSQLNYQLTEKSEAPTYLMRNLSPQEELLSVHMDEFLKQSKSSSQELLQSQMSEAFRTKLANSSQGGTALQCQNLVSPPPQSNAATYAYEMFASFASPNQHQAGVLTMSDVQPLAEGDSSVKQRRLQTLESNRKTNSALKSSEHENYQHPHQLHRQTIQSPTPKFSLNLDRNSLVIDSQKQQVAESARVKRVSLLGDQDVFERRNLVSKSSFVKEHLETVPNYEQFPDDEYPAELQQLDSAETMKRKDNVFFSNESLANYQREQFPADQLDGLGSSKTYDLPTVEYFTEANQSSGVFGGRGKHQKSNSKPSIHFMSKLQFKGPLFQTQQDDRVLNDIFEAESQNENHDSENQCPAMTLHNPGFSPRYEHQNHKAPSTSDGVDRLSLLQRTASLDHYLSNGTTFLRGQRFLSPTSRGEHLNHMSSLKTKEQIKSYFLKLLLKKLAKIRKINLRTSFTQLRKAEQNLKQAKLEKVGILNLVREYVMKSEALGRWKQIRKKEVFKRKGFAVLKMAEALKSLAFAQAFSQIKKTDNYKTVLDPDMGERVHFFAKRWTLKHAWLTWFSFHKYKQFLKKRSLLFQRSLLNTAKKHRLLEAWRALSDFNNNNNSNNRASRGWGKQRFNSLNFKIIEILNKMSEDSVLLPDCHSLKRIEPQLTPAGKNQVMTAAFPSAQRQTPSLINADYSLSDPPTANSPHPAPSTTTLSTLNPQTQSLHNKSPSNLLRHNQPASPIFKQHIAHNSSSSSQSQTLSEIIQPGKVKILRTLAAHQLLEKLNQVRMKNLKPLFEIFKDLKLRDEQLSELSVLQEQMRAKSEQLSYKLAYQRKKLVHSGLAHLQKFFKKSFRQHQMIAFARLRVRSERKAGAVRVLVR